MKKIKVLLADGNAILREGLHLILERECDMEVMGEAADGKETVEKTKKLLPNVVVMDIDMPKLDGLEVTTTIKKYNQNIRVLVFSLCEDDTLVFKLLKRGVDGYVLKKIAGPELVNIIRVVHHGELILSSQIAKKLVDSYLRKPERAREKRDFCGVLTDRETEVFKLIAQGVTNKEIANKLYISKKTVDSHRANIFKKLGIHNQAQAVIYAIRRGLLDQQEQSRLH